MANAGFVERFQSQLRELVDAAVSEVVDKRLRTLSEKIDHTVEEAVESKIEQALGGVTSHVTTRPAQAEGQAPKRKYSMADVREAKEQAGQPSYKTCNVAGCSKKHRAKGYCQGHYQAATKYGWPFPAPRNFSPPARKRGRPASIEQQIASKAV